MVFSSAVFILLFLPITFLINLLVPYRWSNIVLLISSLFFYAWGEPYFIFVLLISITVNHLVGKYIYEAKDKNRKIGLLIGIVFDLLLLLVFKYADFVGTTVNSIVRRNMIEPLGIALPIGISFFTFQAISYIVDVYRGDCKPADNWINVALYISFFPQLIAGPIVKYRDINIQIESRHIDWISISEGFKRFIYGLAKKVIISNTLGMCADKIYSMNVLQIDCKAAWIGSVAYTFQIYYDFSGYSDMAIGLCKMFGFNIPENFNYPYLSKSISEFWRRWHISLGTWFKEYVYIPLGGNRKGEKRTCVNLLLVFLLTGVWHGANYTFIVWGIFHGLFAVLEHIRIKKFLNKHNILSHIYCLVIVNFGWVLFRADSIRYALRYLARMFTPWYHSKEQIMLWQYCNIKTVCILCCAVVGAGILKKMVHEKTVEKWRDSVAEAIFCVVLFVLCLASIASNTYNPFIYFQF